MSQVITWCGIEPEVSYATTSTLSRTGPRRAGIGSWPRAASRAPRFFGYTSRSPSRSLEPRTSTSQRCHQSTVRVRVVSPRSMPAPRFPQIRAARALPSWVRSMKSSSSRSAPACPRRAASRELSSAEEVTASTVSWSAGTGAPSARCTHSRRSGTGGRCIRFSSP
ncbi:hypothetical protein [Streptomyces sp. WM6386]|uniref:hypothetical protein n=1 Tax=Streptomyces sp. WM6386 TaxID=1415558 RepID=UPI003B634C49